VCVCVCVCVCVKLAQVWLSSVMSHSVIVS